MRPAALLLVLLLASSLSGQTSCIPQLDAPREYAAPGPWRLDAVDLDADGNPDVVSSGQFEVSVLYGRGETLEPAVMLIEGGVWWLIEDVDADARPDVVATRYEQSTDTDVTFLLRNLGERRFAAPEELAREKRGVVQAVADFTNDGSPDVLIPRTGRASLLLVNDGRGHFISLESTMLIAERIETVADINGDGNLDLVHTPAAFRLTISLGDGTGAFPAQQTRVFSTELTPAAADLNADGRSDLLAALWSWGQVEIYLDSAAPKPTSRVNAGLPRSVTPGDFNGDGALDLAVLTESTNVTGQYQYAAPRVMIFLNNGDGGLARSRDVLIGFSQTFSPGLHVVTADFNGDGALDLVVPASEGSVGLVFGRGDGTFETPRVLQARRLEAVAMAVDLDGDGIDEVINRGLAVGWLNAAGTYDFEPLPGVHFAIGDVDSRGTRTIVIADVDRIRVLSRTAPRVWEEVSTIITGAGQFLALATGDVTGDGRRELFVVTQDTTSGARLRIYDASGNLLDTRTLVQPMSSGYSLSIVDINHDAKNDLVLTRHGSIAPIHHDPDPIDGYLDALLGRGDGTFDAPRRILDNTRLGQPLTGDYNGDGYVDLATDTRVLFGDGTGGFRVQEIPFYASLAYDLNRDGITDLLSGTAIRQGTRGGTFVHRGTYMFGASLNGLVIARRTINGPLTLLGSMDLEGEIIAADFTCATPRRRTARR
ncbi:MAG TPA: VCBS repeat-containing protein [Thermoanaerobaculia bacterium]|jgi:hypothetical protein